METNVAKNPSRTVPARNPAVDIFENEQEILIHADVPGATAESVKLEVEHGTLRFSAGGAAANWARSFLVPRGIAVDQIRAELVAGVLKVVLPKSTESRRRTVEVKAG